MADPVAFYPARYGAAIFREETMGLSLLTMYKTPFEAFNCTVDFASVVPVGNLSFTAVTAVDMSTGLDVSSSIISASPEPVVVGTGIVLRVQSGTVGQNVFIGVQVQNTDTTEQFEGDVTLVIQ